MTPCGRFGNFYLLLSIEESSLFSDVSDYTLLICSLFSFTSSHTAYQPRIANSTETQKRMSLSNVYPALLKSLFAKQRNWRAFQTPWGDTYLTWTILNVSRTTWEHSTKRTILEISKIELDLQIWRKFDSAPKTYDLLKSQLKTSGL